MIVDRLLSTPRLIVPTLANTTIAEFTSGPHRNEKLLMLVGESLMTAKDVGAKIKELIGREEE